MVNAIKVQQEILNHPLSAGGTLPDGRVYLSFDGTVAFVLLEQACKIDLKKIEQKDYNKYFSENANAKAVWATGTTKMLGKISNGNARNSRMVMANWFISRRNI